jgi:hypothetical protein
MESGLGMTTVVAQPSRNGRNPSKAQQAQSGIAQRRHDFGTIVGMNGAAIFSHGHVFDIMQAVFDRPVSSLEPEQALGNANRGRQTAHAIANLLVPLAFGLPSTQEMEDLLQARPISIAFEFRREANGADFHPSMSLGSFLCVLFW